MPKTKELCSRVLVLPTGGNLGAEGIRVIAGLIRVVVEGAAELRERNVDMSHLRLTKYGETQIPRPGGERLRPAPERG